MTRAISPERYEKPFRIRKPNELITDKIMRSKNNITYKIISNHIADLCFKLISLSYSEDEWN